MWENYLVPDVLFLDEVTPEVPYTKNRCRPEQDDKGRDSRLSLPISFKEFKEFGESPHTQCDHNAWVYTAM